MIAHRGFANDELAGDAVGVGALGQQVQDLKLTRVNCSAMQTSSTSAPGPVFCRWIGAPRLRWQR